MTIRKFRPFASLLKSGRRCRSALWAIRRLIPNACEQCLAIAINEGGMANVESIDVYETHDHISIVIGSEKISVDVRKIAFEFVAGFIVGGHRADCIDRIGYADKTYTWYFGNLAEMVLIEERADTAMLVTRGD